ncbi:hypothetical protein ACJ73_06275, partial [Blastomyces percursus]
GHLHVAVKVYERDSTQAQRELHIFNQLNPIVTEHIGSTLVRTAMDNFDIQLTKRQTFMSYPITPCVEPGRT